ncbi:RodZ domain-containing protein [Paenibacillus sp. UNC499MF]|uniref:helix-turn-helix domain-containing protein n=1 Tax=Paenibacillus sp. UNC499MF TaxID=1502751 RepID=UPI00089FEA90|nr:RodZ domain-containing protein [Paenibacillus sp. UNC499MF]SEF60150.1 protein RodZ, contains Xre-like HTH and DUF4115 domains [Paenibacillus sp. UNC499MF]
MSELGQRLKQARLEKRMSLEDLQEVTKIRTRYLEAIEEENYKVLPGSFYVRAFIKSYAEAVGLDPNEVLNMYQGTVPAAPPEPTVETIRTPRRSSARSTDRLSKWASTIMVVSFVLLIAAIVYYFVVMNNKGDSSGAINEPNRLTDTADPNATAAPSPAPGNGGNTASTNSPAPTPTPSATPTPTPTPPAGALTLVNSSGSLDNYTAVGGKLDITVTAAGTQCWYRVDSFPNSNKKMEKQGTLKQGETETFSLTTTAQIRVGAANAAKITVNGQEINVGDASNPKNIKITLQPQP